jgi:hypothetical protein
MAGPGDDAVVQEIMDQVKSLLDSVMHDDPITSATRLAPGSFVAIGLDLFGTDALRVPMGFAAEPQYLGLTAIQVGEGLAVAELRGRNANEEEVSVCSLFLTSNADGWQVEDLWPVPADGDLQVEAIADPTRLFYSGDLQLALRDEASLDTVERQLVPSMQETGMGLHLLERAVHLWRSFKGAVAPDEGDPAAWAAGLHLAMELLDGNEPDVDAVAARYHVLGEAAIDRFTAVMNQLSAEGEAEPQQNASPPPPPPSGLQILDSSGRPIPRGGRSDQGGGIILPRG